MVIFTSTLLALAMWIIVGASVYDELKPYRRCTTEDNVWLWIICGPCHLLIKLVNKWKEL